MDRSPTIDVTLFVACYNEAANIIGTLENVRLALEQIGCSAEVIVIDDASTDDSVARLRTYRREHLDLPIRLVVNPVNRGLAENFATACSVGCGRYFKLVCGDDVETIEALTRILSHIDQADLILPYHHCCEGKSALRMFLSRTFTILVNLVSGHRVRYYNGLGLFRREHVLRWHSRMSGFAFQADLVTRLLDEGLRPLEIEVPARERNNGSSTALKPRNFVLVARTLLTIFLRRLARAPLPVLHFRQRR